MRLLAAVDNWNAARPAQALQVGVGIPIGEAVTGAMGSPQRKEYTVIGVAVNLAARLEQLTKETGTRLEAGVTWYFATAPEALGGIMIGSKGEVSSRSGVLIPRALGPSCATIARSQQYVCNTCFSISLAVSEHVSVPNASCH
jgi:hypothetical protein